MANYLSEDLRIRVIDAVEAWSSRRQAAARLVMRRLGAIGLCGFCCWSVRRISTPTASSGIRCLAATQTEAKDVTLRRRGVAGLAARNGANGG